LPKSATLYLIRHAEKPAQPDDPRLTMAGEARAQAYVAYFRHLGLSSSSHLIAAADSEHSNRSRLTLTPLSVALSLPIDVSVADHDYARLSEQLLTDARYDQGSTLICWHHGQILGLAQSLGAKANQLPAAWPDAIFGWTIRLRYDGNGHVEEVQVSNQKLMFGDGGASP